jgi:hypothetical protein
MVSKDFDVICITLKMTSKRVKGKDPTDNSLSSKKIKARQRVWRGTHLCSQTFSEINGHSNILGVVYYSLVSHTFVE